MQVLTKDVDCEWCGAKAGESCRTQEGQINITLPGLEKVHLCRSVDENDPRVVASLPGECWLDEDGRHVWWRHLCLKDGKRVTLDWMLPWPHWKAGEPAVQGGYITVTPSIVCTVPNCNFHSLPLIGKPPSDWTPRPTLIALMSEAAHDTTA